MTYRHGEAFCLMWYSCNCGHRERIWNSRDGVTPFGMTCPSCGKSTLQHVDWEKDWLARDHKPYRGQRLFVDGTPDEALAIITKRALAWAATGSPIPGDALAAMRKEVQDQTGEWQKGWPSIRRQEGRPPAAEQIKYMVDRFLTWKLPANFNPDGGISFKADFNEHTDHPMKHEPVGTNLFDAEQADAMVRHMIDGLP